MHPYEDRRKVSSSQLKRCRIGPRKKRTYIVEVDIDATVMREYEVSDGICPLYRLGVIVESVQEPRVFSSNELA